MTDTPKKKRVADRQEVVVGESVKNLKRMAYSPHKNPLLEGLSLDINRRRVRVSAPSAEYVDTDTGEITASSAIYTFEDRDDESFVKIFSQGVAAAFALKKTATRVFQVVLGIYETTPMRRGYADSLYIAWFDGGLSGQTIGMTDRTFHAGLKELVEKGFLYPKAPNLYWVNPALFFKGDRVKFIREYRRPARGNHVSHDENDNAAASD